MAEKPLEHGGIPPGSTKPKASQLPVAVKQPDDQGDDHEDTNTKEVQGLTKKYLERIGSKQEKGSPQEEKTGITDDEGSDDDDKVG